MRYGIINRFLEKENDFLRKIRLTRKLIKATKTGQIISYAYAKDIQLNEPLASV